jgi:Phage integrase, N-terminal SAM-like domain
MVLQINVGMRYLGMPDTPLVIRESSPISPRPPKLLDRVREANRLRHGSRSTEKSYVGWIRRYILFHGKRHPAEMGAPMTCPTPGCSGRHLALLGAAAEPGR